MQTADENFQVEGNREVVAFLERWHKEALKGKLNFVGLIACKSATETFTDHVGVMGTEFAAYFAAANMQMQIMGNVFRRLPPQINPNAPANRVVYNLAAGPCSFDFLAWIQTQEMRRVKEGAPGPLQVAFSMGQDNQIDRCLVTDQRKVMYEGVMKALIPMMGAVQSYDLENCRWPDTYTLNAAVELYNNGVPMPKLVIAPQARERIREYLNGRTPVVITLRESDKAWPHRNSDVEEWLKFADYLTGKGEDVIFVRDTAKAKEPLGAYPTLPPASIELNTRVALMEQAKVNFFCSNGPCTLAFFTDKPWFMLGPLDPKLAYPCGRPEWWLPHHGIPAYGQFPWSGPNQRIIWELDRFEHMVSTWEKYEAGEFNCPAPKNEYAPLPHQSLDPIWSSQTPIVPEEPPPGMSNEEAQARWDELVRELGPPPKTNGGLPA